MAAAYLRAPDLPESMLVLTTFDPGCTGKVRQSRVQAGAAAARRRCGGAYRCPDCGGWHTSRVTGPAVPKRLRPS